MRMIKLTVSTKNHTPLKSLNQPDIRIRNWCLILAFGCRCGLGYEPSLAVDLFSRWCSSFLLCMSHSPLSTIITPTINAVMQKQTPIRFVRPENPHCVFVEDKSPNHFTAGFFSFQFFFFKQRFLGK